MVSSIASSCPDCGVVVDLSFQSMADTGDKFGAFFVAFAPNGLCCPLKGSSTNEL